MTDLIFHCATVSFYRKYILVYIVPYPSNFNDYTLWYNANGIDYFVKNIVKVEAICMIKKSEMHVVVVASLDS